MTSDAKGRVLRDTDCELCGLPGTTFVSGIGSMGEGAMCCKTCAESMERSKNYDE